MADPSTDPRAVLLGVPNPIPGELAGVMGTIESDAARALSGALPDLAARPKLNRYATALCSHMDMGNRRAFEADLWQDRIKRVTQAALLLVHQAQGNAAGIPAEGFAAARRELWPAAA